VGQGPSARISYSRTSSTWPIHPPAKEEYLYVVEGEHPLRLLDGNRVLSSVMSRNRSLEADFRNRYGLQFARACENNVNSQADVRIVSLKSIVPFFTDGFGEHDFIEDVAE
jgi:hypothetical protein